MQKILPFVFVLLLSQFVFAQNCQHDHCQGYCTSPNPLTITQTDGSSISIIGKGNRFQSRTETTDGYTIIQNSSGIYEYAQSDNQGNLISSGIKANDINQRNQQEIGFLSSISKHLQTTNPTLNPQTPNPSIQAPATFPTTGTHRVLVILIQYPNLTSNFSRTTFNNFMNQTNFNSTGSFKDYFTENSFNQLTLNTDVFGWYTAANNYTYYGNNNGTNRARQLGREAIDAAEAAGVNFANYDNDGDGEVDGVIFVHSGPGAEQGAQTQFIWSHRSSLGTYSRFYDGVLINDYMFNPETRSPVGTANPRMVGIGVFCHEFGHILGLPDLYDTDGSNGDSEGIGEWGLMGSAGWLNLERTPAHFSAWAKDVLGWQNPTVLNSSGNYTLMPASSNNQSYRINTPDPDEYFLLENRHRSNFDAFLNGEGMVIWHINTTKTSLYPGSNTVNADENLKGVDVEEADGSRDLDNETNRGDAGDVYPGTSSNTNFDNLSNPNSRTYNNANSNVDISNIAKVGNNVNFTFGGVTQPNLATRGTPTVNVSGTNVTINTSIENNGTVAANSSTLAYYLSTNTIISTSDYLIGTDLVGFLNPSSFGSETITVDVASMGIPLGTYYIGYLIDYQNVVTESNENDNSHVWLTPQVTISPTSGCGTTISNFPYTEGFETGLGAWVQDPTDDFDWTRFSGSTSSPNTGPTSANTGSFYLYTEATGNNPSRTANLEGPCFNFSALTAPQMHFAAHMWGVNMGDLNIDVSTNQGSTWTNIGFISGDQGNQWTVWTADLSAYAGMASVKIRFRGITGSGFESDISIDDILIQDNLSFCSGTSFLTAASGSFSDGSGASNYGNNSDCSWLIQPIGATNVTLNFTAFDTEAGFDSVYVYNGATTASPLLGGFTGTTLPPQLISGNTMLVRFVSDGSVTAQGFSANYTSNAVACGTTISSFPYSEGFETGIGLWQQYTADDFDWTRQSGSTLSNNTGPTSASVGSFYIYTEATTPNNPNKVAIIESPCFDFSNLIAPEMTFDAHMWGGDMGDLNIDVSTDQGGTWTLLGFISGDQGNQWQRFVANLAPYAGQNSVKIRFRGVTGLGFESDMAIDDILVDDVPSFCAGTTLLVNNAGTVTDGSGTFDYQDNADCYWVIQPPNAKNISLEFREFDTESGFDFVRVYDGATTADPLLGTYSGNAVPPTILNSTGGVMLIHFISDASNTDLGWSANYTSVRDCNFALEVFSDTTVIQGDSAKLRSKARLCGNLPTTLLSGIRQNGNMFDVVATNYITITDFEILQETSIVDYEIYYKTGTHVGAENNAAAWTLLGTANGVTANSTSSTKIPIPINLNLIPGQRMAFYVTASDTGYYVNYSIGSGVGNVFMEDENLRILEGTGNAYPFANVFSPRIFNGIVNYKTDLDENSLLITEIMAFRGGTGTQASFPAFIPPLGDDFIEVTNLSGKSINLSGLKITLEANSSTFERIFTSGTLASGAVLTIPLGTGIDDPINNLYYLGDGSTSNQFGSISDVGVILSNNNTGRIIDVVAKNAYNFPISSGITEAHWAGVSPISATFAGIFRTGSTDSNNPSDWQITNALSPSSIGLLNFGLTGLSTGVYTWSDGINNIGNTDCITVAPNASTTYDCDLQIGSCSSNDTARVTVTPQGNSIQLWAANVTGGSGNQVIVPFRVSNFRNIVSFQGTINFNQAIATYDTVRNFALPTLFAGNFGTGQANSGIITYSWLDNLLLGPDLPDSTILFEMIFNIVGAAGTQTPIDFINAPTLLEFADSNFVALPATYTSGSITVANTVNISGIAKSELNSPIRSTTFNLTSPTGNQNWVSGTNGAYNFNIPSGAMATITPSKNNDTTILNGITTLDIALIQRRILNGIPLGSPYKIIAADVNESTTLTGIDLALIQSMILQRTFSFPGNKLWQFVPADYAFPNPSNPFPYPNAKVHVSAMALANQDFIGMRMGDVNNSWDPNVARPSVVGHLGFMLQNQNAEIGKELVVPVCVKDFQNVSGYQFTMNWNDKILKFKEVKNVALNAQYGENKTHKGKLTTSWYNPNGTATNLADGTIAFEIYFEIVGNLGEKSTVEINSSLTPVEAFNGNLDLLAVQTNRAEITVSQATNLDFIEKDGFVLYQNQPNPFSENTLIKFQLPENQAVQFKIVNALGQEIFSKNQKYPAGENQLIWNGTNQKGNNLPSGTYFLQMETEGFRGMIKILLVR